MEPQRRLIHLLITHINSFLVALSVLFRRP
jgi:hypothetical protein